MESIAEQLVGQVLGEKQVYLDNARLKHGVPRHDSPIQIAAPEPQRPTPPTSVVGDVMSGVSQAAPQKSSFAKTAAMLALSAAAGAFGIPPIVTALAGKTIVEKITPAEPQREETPPQEFSDLVNWLRQKGLDRGIE